MDTVTEAPLAIAMAQEGGIGIVHKNLSPAAQAAEEVRIRHFDLDNEVEVDARITQGFNLRQGAWKSVHDETVGAIRGFDAFLDQADDHRIRHQGAAVHVRLGFHAQLGAGLDHFTQHVAGGDLRNLVVLNQELGLSAFAGTGQAEKKNAHGLGPFKGKLTAMMLE